MKGELGVKVYNRKIKESKEQANPYKLFFQGKKSNLS